MLALSLLLLTVGVSSVSAQFGKKPVGNNNYVTITKPVEDFMRLTVWPKVNVYHKINADSVGQVRIHGEENIVHFLDFTVKKGKMDIAFINNMSVDFGFITVHIYSSDLTEAEVAGEGVLELNSRIDNPEIKLVVGGSGQINAKDLQAGVVKAHIAGGGDIKLAGKTGMASYTVNGTGEIRGRELVAEEVSCNSTGTGDILCNVEKLLKARLIGTGNVYYDGEPVIKRTVIGKGKLIKQVEPIR